MQGEIFVSGKDRVTRLTADGGCAAQTALCGAGVLRLCGDTLLCCGAGGALWRLDAQSLVPRALFAGGPGVRELCTGEQGEVYVLCADADSVLMLDGKTGLPQVLNRAGVGPMGMAIDAQSGVLAVAGGESGSVIVLCCRSLERLAELPMPGPVYDVAFTQRSLYALCLNERLDSLLVRAGAGGARRMWALRGMPGALAVWGNQIAAATEAGVYVICGVDGTKPCLLPCCGRPKRLCPFCSGLLAVDAYTDVLLRIGRDMAVCSLAEGVADACTSGA